MKWSYRILLAYSGFICMMLYFVYVSSQQSNDLMDESYYEKEQEYQKVVEGSSNLSQFQTKVQVNVQNEDVLIQVPAESAGSGSSCKIVFICLSDKSKDRTFQMSPDSNGLFRISGTEFIPAQYQVRMEWAFGGKSYAYRNTFYYSRA